MVIVFGDNFFLIQRMKNTVTVEFYVWICFQFMLFAV